MKAKDITIDKELRDLIPPLSQSEDDLLEKSILEEGIREPLIISNGVLIDGHHRHDIARKHDLDFRVQEMEFASRNDIVLWMCQNQLGRRNISSIDKVALGLRMEGALKEKAKANMALSPGCKGLANLPKVSITPIDVREAVATAVNMGARTYDKGKEVLERSTPQQIQAIRDGDASIHSRFVEITAEKEAAKIKNESANNPYQEFFTPEEKEAIDQRVRDTREKEKNDRDHAKRKETKQQLRISGVTNDANYWIAQGLADFAMINKGEEKEAGIEIRKWLDEHGF